MKQALLMVAVEPRLGGVLVFGDRGTGKSTSVRALADLLPKISVNDNCRYNCEPDKPAESCPMCNSEKPTRVTTKSAPIVDLPLGSTEDRLCGSLDLERALVSGERVFEPGLLAKAHRGFLYIDEVNLLEDHLVDLLLDVAASGTNVVEREGLSIQHPARFVLVGSGNPEEGELRPQLLDRFGLSVDVRSPEELSERVQVIKRREAFEHDPDAFCDSWLAEEKDTRKTIVKAKKLIPNIVTSDRELMLAAALCSKLGVDGLRGELTLIRAAKARAALEGRQKISSADIVEDAPMALRHRLRRNPLDDAGSEARVSRAVHETLTVVSGNA